MTAIYSIGGIGNLKNLQITNGRGNLMIDEDSIGAISQDELHLLSHKQLLELEQQMIVNKKGKGSNHDNAYELEIIAVNNALAHIERAAGRKKLKFRHRNIIGRGHAGAPTKRVPQVIPKVSGSEDFIAGKKKAPKTAKAPKVNKKAAKAVKKTAKAVAKNTAGKALNKKDQKRVQKLNIVVNKKKTGLLKKIGKGIVKAVTFIPKTIAKGVSTTILRATLPKNAPFFLYLFLADPKDTIRSAKILSKAPDAVLQKRSQELRIQDTIIKKLGMKPATFLNIIRSGIINRYGMPPEEVLAKWMKDANFSVGFVTEALNVAQGGLDMLGKLLGLNFKEMEEMVPVAEDWGMADQQAIEDISSGVTQLPGAQPMVRDETEEQYTSQPVIYSNDLRPVPTPYNQPSYSSPSYSGGGTTGSRSSFSDDREDGKNTVTPPEEEEPEEAEASPAAGGNNMLMMGGLGLGLLMLMSKGKK